MRTTTLETESGELFHAQYKMLPGNIAEIRIDGFGYIHVDGEEFVLHPVTPVCSARLAQRMRTSPRTFVGVMDAVEGLASEIFPTRDSWLWGLHDQGFCAACSN